MTPLIDGLQYANWSEKIFSPDARGRGGCGACHHHLSRDLSRNRAADRALEPLVRALSRPDLPGPHRRRRGRLPAQTGRTAIFFGAQNPSCIEDDIGLVEILHTPWPALHAADLQQPVAAGDGLLRGRGYRPDPHGPRSGGRDEPRRHGGRHEPFGRTLDPGGDRAFDPPDRHHPCQPGLLAPGAAQQIRRGAARAGRKAAGCWAFRSIRIT